MTGEASRRLVRPRRPAFWVLVGLGAVGAALLASAVVISVRHGDGPFLAVAAVAWLVWALVVGFLICRADLFDCVPTPVRLAAFGWGVLASVQLSGLLVGPVGALVPERLAAYRAAFAAPVPEEAGKLLGVVLLALLVPAVLRRPMGALVCGSLSGLGFATNENWRMSMDAVGGHGLAGRLGGLGGWVLTRGVVDGPVGHSLYSAVCALGVCVVLARGGRPAARVLAAIGLFLAGSALHAVNNALVGTGNIALVVGYGLVQIVALVLLLAWGRRTERRRFTRVAAGPAMADIIGPDDVPALLTRKARRRAARADGGRSASAAHDRQRRQIERANAVDG